MPEYLSPGVYVEEVSSGSKPIEGVSTSTAGFAGQTERGPTAPRLVTSWLEYQRWYGSYATDGYLPYATQGFFDNGGQRVFIAADAVCSRAKHNWRFALEVMRQAGAVIGTTEMLLFLMNNTAGTDRFIKLSRMVR